MRLTELQFKKYSDDQVRYESLIADLEKIEKASPVVGLYLTDSNIDAENAGVSHDHPDFYELCYHIAEDRMWVQTQAPAGNWVNTTGIPVWYHDPDSVKGARIQAENYAEYERKHGRNARVTRQYYEVL